MIVYFRCFHFKEFFFLSCEANSYLQLFFIFFSSLPHIPYFLFARKWRILDSTMMRMLLSSRIPKWMNKQVSLTNKITEKEKRISVANNEIHIWKSDIEHHITVLYPEPSPVRWLLFQCLPSRLRTLALFVIHSLQVSTYLFNNARLGWKVHRLIKIVLWNVNECGLFLNIAPLAVHTLLSLVL